MKDTPEALYKNGQLVLSYLLNYLEDSRLGKEKVLQMLPLESLANQLELEELIRTGGLDSSNLGSFLGTYLDNTQHLHHPGYIGHQVAVPHVAGALADLVHGITNNPIAIYEMGPAGITMELVVINWMLEKIGWIKNTSLKRKFSDPDQPAGVMTHGGSLANLTVLLAARAHIAPESWEEGTPSDLVVLAPQAAHYSIGRAISIMGMGKKAIVGIPVDEQERINPGEVKRIIDEQRADGKRIMALVANGCATSTGYFDALDEIGRICNEEKVWLHVDAPHGATVLTSQKLSYLMKGIERADSTIWDAHKLMKTSGLGTAILFKKQRHMAGALQQKGSYIFHDKEQPGVDFIQYTVECTKSGMGMKLFWVLAAMGEKGIAQYVETLFENTMAFYDVIEKEEGFACFGKPESNILCFRYRETEFNQLEIRNQLVKSGNFYITSTEINESRYLRLTVMNTQTNTNTIKSLMNEIKSICK